MMLRKRRSVLLIPVAVVMLLLLTGCPKDNWQRAAQLSDDFAHSIKAAQDLEIAAHDKQLIADTDHQAIQQVFLEVAQDGQKLDSAIRSGVGTQTITQAFQVALSATQGALQANTLHIKDANLKAEIEIALTGAKGILDTMEALK